MDNLDPRKSTYSFRPLARTVVMLGEELISDQSVAIMELVKNSYDADATKVVIDIDRNNSIITITDNGYGMTEDDILYKWLVPATTSKTIDENGHKRKTDSGRVEVGGKGIGRFAVHHLGRKLELATRPILESNELVLIIDWNQYENPNLYLDEINNTFLKRNPLLIKTQIGTCLKITDLKNTWDEQSVEKLKDTLTKLFSDQKKFGIKLIIDKNEIEIPEGRDRYLETVKELEPEYSLVGSVDSQGNYIGTFNGKSHNINLLMNKKVEIRRNITSCGPFNISFFVFDRSAITKTKQDEKQAKLYNLLDEVRGILVFRDGIRIFPYGNPTVDWLELDKRRSVELDKLSNRQILAFVDITYDKNPSLVDKTNREGFIENAAFQYLKSVLMSIVQDIENLRIKLKDEKRKDEETRRLPIVKLIENVQKVVPIESKPQVAELKKAVTEELKHKDERLKVMVELSGIGLAAEKSTHEINKLLIVVEDSLGKTKDIITELLEKYNLDIPIKDLIFKVKQFIFEAQDALKILEKQIKGMNPLYKASRAKKKDIDVSETVQKAFRWFEKVIKDSDIDLTIDEVGTLKLFENEGLLIQVLMNLIDNSIYWLRTIDPPRKIKVIFNGRLNCIYVSDNGPGIIEGEEEIIFEPLVSRKEDGRGLGLYIARELLEKQGHHIELTPMNERLFNKGAEFKIIFNSESRRG